MRLRALQVFHGFSQKDKGKIRENQSQHLHWRAAQVSVAKKKMSELLSEGQNETGMQCGSSALG